MLSAAVAALLAAPALADTTLTKVETTTQKTSATGNLTINSGAGVSFKSATVPLIEIDSSKTVNNGGALTAADQTTATAVQIDANGLTGSFVSNGAISLTGTGTGKTAIYIKGTGAFTGNISLDSNSTVAIAGDQSTGINMDTTATLNGDVLLAGTFAMAPTAANSSTATGLTIANLAGTINGNVIVSAASSYSAIGNGAQGFVIGIGGIHACNTTATPGCTEIGTFSNSGTIAVGGVSVRKPNAKNVESGSALVINGSINGGILNNGPASTGDATAAASITGNGVSPVVSIAGGAVPITIGVDTADTANGNSCSNGTAAIGCSFINRGSILAVPVDPNENSRGIVISGSAAAPITFTGGFFNSGTISASATSITPGTAVSVRAMEIDSNVTLPEIHVSGQTISTTTGTGGSILASVTGPQGGSAIGLILTSTTGTSVPVLTVERGGRIASSSVVTNPATAGVNEVSIAVEDDSGSLKLINNAGTISATATTLTNGNTAQTTALFLATNTTGVMINNTGAIVGDVILGSGSDTYYIAGSATTGTASQTGGTIDFGRSLTGNGDLLHVGQLANVAGTIKSEGTLDVKVDGTGVLTVQNVGSTMATRNLTIAGGNSSTAGTLNITVSQTANVPVITSSGTVTFGSGALMNVDYGSFITQGGSFILIQAPTGGLGISAPDIARYSAQVGCTTGCPSNIATLPFLFQSASIAKASDNAGHDNLVLSVFPKTAAQLGLTGYAKALFPFANTALSNDSLLGAAFVAGVNSPADAQKAYGAFAPDLSGGVRAIAISLTDQGTGVVAARQRTLRLFAKEQGDLTLWGNEFGQYITYKGGTVKADPNPASSTAYLNSGAATGFKDHGFGFALGLDTGSAADGWYGAAFSFYSGDVSEGGPKDARDAREQTLWYMLTGYTDWRGRGLFFDSQLNIGYGDVKGKRFINLVNPTTNSTFTREADSKRATLLASIGFTAGAQMHYGGLFMTPQVSLDGLTMREEGYTETGGGTAFNLTVKPSYADSLRVFLGTDFRGNINLGDFLLQPSARLGYRYDLLNNPTKLRAQFADLNPALSGNQPGALFILRGPDPSRGNVVAGGGLNATTENWTIGVNFDYVRGSHNETEEVGTLSLLGRI